MLENYDVRELRRVKVTIWLLSVFACVYGIIHQSILNQQILIGPDEQT